MKLVQYVEKVIILGVVTITVGGGKGSRIEESSVSGGFVGEVYLSPCKFAIHNLINHAI
jgi:hypothetical protein